MELFSLNQYIFFNDKRKHPSSPILTHLFNSNRTNQSLSFITTIHSPIAHILHGENFQIIYAFNRVRFYESGCFCDPSNGQISLTDNKQRSKNSTSCLFPAQWTMSSLIYEVWIKQRILQMEIY